MKKIKKDIKKVLTKYHFAIIILNVFARVAQWWSTSLPRRGSRVRFPSRAYK